jgi:hypothetical protein
MFGQRRLDIPRHPVRPVGKTDTARMQLQGENFKEINARDSAKGGFDSDVLLASSGFIGTLSFERASVRQLSS